ncbi:hypothetical protein [Streptomyces venezuelae]|uniref:hypothetical protein n=1 Tax=Streptomyces venezuelae TaxID=54571 RepID=UPI00331D01F3
MADLYALDLAFDLLGSTPDDVLAQVRRELTSPDGLLSARGPAWRVGGMLVGEFAPAERGGWALTARQEVHEEQLPEMEDLLLLVAPPHPPAGPGRPAPLLRARVPGPAGPARGPRGPAGAGPAVGAWPRCGTRSG